MDSEERRRLIKRYKDGHQVVVAVLAGISDAELDARQPGGEWTAREIVHHLADSETTSAIRLRRLLAEENPEIAGYDEEAFAQRLHYDRPITADLALFGAVRRSSAEILDRLGAAEWARTGTHAASGSYGVEEWLRIYADHAHDHADQIHRARSAGLSGSGLQSRVERRQADE